MKTKTIFRSLYLFFLLITFTNCDENTTDCLLGIKPNLISKQMNTAVAFQQYSDNIYFEMANTSTDSYFISDIIIEGNLPPGINYKKFNSNGINFYGAPNTTGTYSFTVRIKVQPNYSNNGSTEMCDDMTSNNYTIKVE